MRESRHFQPVSLGRVHQTSAAFFILLAAATPATAGGARVSVGIGGGHGISVGAGVGGAGGTGLSAGIGGATVGVGSMATPGAGFFSGAANLSGTPSSMTPNFFS